MPDDIHQPNLEHSFQIQLNERWEIDFWTRMLQVSEEQLREAIGQVGCDVQAVRQYLQFR